MKKHNTLKIQAFTSPKLFSINEINNKLINHLKLGEMRVSWQS